MGLREQMLKAGLVSPQQVQSVEQLDKAKERAQRAGKGRAPEAPVVVKVLSVEERERLLRDVAALAEAHRAPVEKGGRRWYVALRDGRIAHLELSEKTASDLECGKLGILEHAAGRPVVVTADGALAARALDPSAVRCFNRG